MIKYSNVIKYLGIYLDNKLKYDKHIQKITNKIKIFINTYTQIVEYIKEYTINASYQL